MKKIILFILCCVISSVTFSQQKDSVFLITDSVKVIEMDETIVTGYSKNNSQRLHQFFKNNKSGTTEDILVRLPELSMIRRGSYGMEPLIRSYNTGQISVLLDGMRIHGACTDKMDPVTIYIEPANLQNIQLQSGNGFISGSNIGGTLNMLLAQPQFGNDKTITGILSSGYQTAAHALYESAVLNYSKEKWSVRANATYRKSNNYRDGNGKTVDYSQYEKSNYSLSVRHKFKKDWIGKMDLLLDEGRNIGYAALPMDVGYAGAKIAAVSVSRDFKERTLQRIEAKIYANSVKHFMDDTHRKDVAMHMDMPGVSRTAGVYFDAKYKLSCMQHISFRGDISSTFLKASMTMYQPSQPDMYMLTWPDNRKLQAGISAVYQRNLNDGMQVKLSSRLDAVKYSLNSKTGRDQLSVFNYSTDDIFYFLKNISLEGIKKITGNIQAGLNVSYSERTASASELYGFYLFNSFDGYDYVGNTGLKTEHSFKAEAHVLLNATKVRMLISGYAARINNYIIGKYQSDLSTMTIGANGVKVYENIAYAKIAGVEASLFYKPVSSLQIVSTCKYAAGSDNNNVPLPLIAPFKNIISVRKQFSQFSVQAESETATAQNRISKYAGEKKTTGYFIANIRATYNGTFGKNRYSMDAGFENIFDMAYREHLDWGGINRPGRNLILHLSLSF